MIDNREKRMQEIRKYIDATRRWNKIHPKLSNDPMLTLSDIDLLLEEIEQLNLVTRQSLLDLIERDVLQTERDKAIDGLRWYASDNNWGSIEEYGALVSDGGDKARTILSELGAPTDDVITLVRNQQRETIEDPFEH